MIVTYEFIEMALRLNRNREVSMRKAIAMAGMIAVLGTAFAASPAKADDDWHGRGGEDWHEGRGREHEHEWRERAEAREEWREHAWHNPYYAPNAYYYPPPVVAYAPPRYYAPQRYYTAPRLSFYLDAD